MLQYPMPHPPLSISSPKSHQAAPVAPTNDHHGNNKRFFRKDSQISVATNISSSSPSHSPLKLAQRSPYISSPKPLPSPVSLLWKSSLPPLDTTPSSRRSSISSIKFEDVLSPGDIVGEDGFLQGELIRSVSIGVPPISLQEPAKEFEVVRRLGTGSYAVVYLVRELISHYLPSEDGLVGTMDFDNRSTRSLSIEYGREFAIKCLSKADLNEEALIAQLTEVSIHQSLPSHPNIVTLHRTLETSSFLLLLLEFVPGEDLFYFLEQARDHYESDSPTDSRTPPTPSLLSNLHPSQLLSRTRLRLIASMFSQMCDAVAACHEQNVFHRDIKPENFIVTDGWTTLADGRRERKVIVKLSDFGLSTTDADSSDMDCGSAPYMSYECRNNVAPTYRPRAADVWSLGIVLINMLYHYNPWTDTAEGACPSFALYLQQPVAFFMQRFTGMTRSVAEFLATRVFCLLDGPDPTDDSRRIGAREFGQWVRDLPSLLGDPHPPSASGHKRGVSTSSITGHRLSASIPSHRPSSRQASFSGAGLTPAIHSRSLSRAPSLGPAYEMSIEHEPVHEACELSTVIDQEVEEAEELENNAEPFFPEEEEVPSRSQSNTKRRKRGARKGKSASASTSAAATPAAPTFSRDATLETLASASQTLAREISRASRTSSKPSSRSVRGGTSGSPPSMFPLPFHYVPNPPPPVPPLIPQHQNQQTQAPPALPQVVVKKPSKWKLGFGKASHTATTGGRVSPVEEAAAVSPVDTVNSVASASASLSGAAKPMSTTASNVTSLIMGLNAPTPVHGGSIQSESDHSSVHSRGRDRRPKAEPPLPHHGPPAETSGTWGPSNGRAFSPNGRGERWGGEKRGVSPTSTRSGRPLASSSSSVVSSNWRSSMSSAGTSTSAFTRYSNSSKNSVSTTATSVSASSWRTQAKPPSQTSPQQPQQPGPTRPIPRNIKFMTGVPWELDELPRQMHPNPTGDIFGQPPVRKQRARKPKDVKLDTISERPPQKTTPLSQRRDAMTSTTDLDDVNEDGSPKKVHKGQITALAKMLSALRR